MTRTYSVDNRVRLPRCADTIGVITAIMSDSESVQYRVVWWHEERRYHEWLYPHEMRPSDAKATV